MDDPLHNSIREDAWRDEYRIRYYEVDGTGRIPLHVLLSLLQESASNHAQDLGIGSSHLRAMNQIWVLSGIHIEVRRCPSWGDTVSLYTWPAGLDRLHALREFRIVDAREELIVSASSAWLVLDAVRRRPVRIEPLFQKCGVPVERDKHSSNVDRVPDPEQRHRVATLTVKYSDQDFNDHVSSSRYVEWILNSYPKKFLDEHMAAAGSINFLAECSCGNEIEIVTEEGEDLSFLHSAQRRSDGREVCRASITWRSM